MPLTSNQLFHGDLSKIPEHLLGFTMVPAIDQNVFIRQSE